MSKITAALVARLAGDDELTAMLAPYADGPAIFTGDPIPEDAVAPFLLYEGSERDVPNDTKNTPGREVRLAVRAISATKGSALEVETIAERVRALLHREPLDLGPGELCYVAEVFGPDVAPTDPDLQGRAVFVRLLTQER